MCFLEVQSQETGPFFTFLENFSSVKRSGGVLRHLCGDSTSSRGGIQPALGKGSLHFLSAARGLLVSSHSAVSSFDK